MHHASGMHDSRGWLLLPEHVPEEEFQPARGPEVQPGGGDGLLEFHQPGLWCCSLRRRHRGFGSGNHRVGTGRELLNLRRELEWWWLFPPWRSRSSSIKPEASSLFNWRTPRPKRSMASCSTWFLSRRSSATIFSINSRCFSEQFQWSPLPLACW